MRHRLSQTIQIITTYFAILRRSIPLLQQAASLESVILIFGLMLQGLLPALSIWLTKNIVDLVVGTINQTTTFGNLIIPIVV
jgi:ATP-binding cassette subfamily B protein